MILCQDYGDVVGNLGVPYLRVGMDSSFSQVKAQSGSNQVEVSVRVVPRGMPRGMPRGVHMHLENGI